MPILLDLFCTFFRIGAFTFGGGYAMLPMLQREIVEKKKWAAEEDLLDYFAVGQCTPGVIAVNTATFVGYKKEGVAGGIMATLGVVAPSLVIITVIAAVLSNFAHIPAVRNAFAGIRVAVGLLILDVGIRMAKKMPKEPIRMILLIAALILTVLISFFSWKISTITLLLTAALISLAVFFVRDRKGKDGEQA